MLNFIGFTGRSDGDYSSGKFNNGFRVGFTLE